jgi:hypothetical protein
MSWLDSAKHVPCTEVASRLGYEVSERARAISTHCPSCGSVTRHTKSGDKRGAVGIKPGGLGWRCFQCDAAGDGIDFASYVLHGSRYRELADDHKKSVRDWFCPDGTDRPAIPAVERERPMDLPPGFENASAEYPPKGCVDDLWDSCADVVTDNEVMDYLRFRSIDAGVSDFDSGSVARALQPGPLPFWASMSGRSWAESGHRLILPLYSHHGVVRSLVARSVKRNPTLKSTGPSFGRRGLVMAGPTAQLVLRLGTAGRFHARRKLEVLIYEGEISFLQNAHRDQEDHRPDGVYGHTAVFGIQQGSWTRDVAARIPNGSLVRIRTHDDEPGKKYAEQIKAVMAGGRVEFVEELEPND